ncbi:MAG TPA: mannose-1-phosphate guanylyltransferase [Pirellulales bacterium]|jgi:mannose-1-phosphate guanylyltransferase|nr:mannose-1-phosphate guanylyltransferase [Pirellulales bacterium]
MLHIVIMAGGAGTRFWPESRAARPKQLLPLAGERTMLQMAVDRLGTLAVAKQLWILTGAALVDAVKKQLPQLPPDHILGEPCKRDTAPCIGLAALLLARHDPQATMAVMPADQVIQPDDQFQQAVSFAAALVEESPGRIVTFGIRPTYPATTFGYIERGEPLESQSAGSAGKKSSSLFSFHVSHFREKPPAAVAQEYLSSGKFYWNSGIFVWKAATIISALEQRQPEMLARLQKIVDAWDQPSEQEVFAHEFAAIKGISIDYAVMEQAADVAVIEAPFTWDDVGTWQAVARLAGTDAEGNTIAGRHLGIDTHGSIIRTDEHHLVATVGVHDLIVVHTPDATLVANRSDEESIRKIVKLLEERGWKEHL